MNNKKMNNKNNWSINFIYIHIFLNQSAKEATWNILEKKIKVPFALTYL